MKGSDLQIRHDVEAELAWDSRFESREIGVTVINRVVTLTGHVSSYEQSRAVQEAVQSVEGVSAVANELRIQLPTDSTLSDANIAESALQALCSRHAVLPPVGIRVAVQGGWVSLEGAVDTHLQKEAAEDAVSGLRGVAGVSNKIAVGTQASSVAVETHILDALRRLARSEFERIRVATLDGTVTLEGEVGSLQERQEVKAAAWQTPGVRQVIDNLIVDPQP